MIVSKAVKMANMMHIPVLGVVENYSYFECPDCGKRHSIFGNSHLEQVAMEYHLPVLAQLPIDPSVAYKCDNGEAESLNSKELEAALAAIMAE